MGWETTQENSVILRLNWLFVRELFTKQEDSCCVPTRRPGFPELPYISLLLQPPLVSLCRACQKSSLPKIMIRKRSCSLWKCYLVAHFQLDHAKSQSDKTFPRRPFKLMKGPHWSRYQHFEISCPLVLYLLLALFGLSSGTWSWCHRKVTRSFAQQATTEQILSMDSISKVLLKFRMVSTIKIS